MPKLEFDPKFSIGNIVTILSVIIMVAGQWFTVLNRQTALDGKMASIEQTIAQGRADRIAAISAHEARIRQLEIGMASQTSDLRNIQQGISEIKAQLDKIASKP